VAALLQAAGHRAYAPSLTGLGDRAHLLTADVGVDTHAADLVELMERDDLDEVILVGHSYAGMVITAAADLAPSRVAHLVYVDTFVPRDGEAITDIMPMQVAAFEEMARDGGDGWRVPPPEMPPGVAGIYGVTEEPDVSWVRSMQTPQSLKTFQQVLRMKNPAAVAAIPRTHLHCTEGGDEYKRLRAIAMQRTYPPSDEPGARVRKLPTGHDCMITMPREVTEVLLEAARVEAARVEAPSRVR
jgi:pimeloyl-ACP methyl ester carboxylesterase